MNPPPVPRISVFVGAKYHYATEGVVGPYLFTPDNFAFAVSADDIPAGSDLTLKEFAKQEARRRNIPHVVHLDD